MGNSQRTPSRQLNIRIPPVSSCKKCAPTSSGNMVPTFARNVSDKIEVDDKMYPAPTATVIGYAGW
jgi:hypothetical protein